MECKGNACLCRNVRGMHHRARHSRTLHLRARHVRVTYVRAIHVAVRHVRSRLVMVSHVRIMHVRVIHVMVWGSLLARQYIFFKYPQSAHSFVGVCAFKHTLLLSTANVSIFFSPGGHPSGEPVPSNLAQLRSAAPESC
jgi:hypothetical protein